MPKKQKKRWPVNRVSKQVHSNKARLKRSEFRFKRVFYVVPANFAYYQEKDIFAYSNTGENQ